MLLRPVRRVDVDKIHPREGAIIDPITVDEQNVRADSGHGGFQMETAVKWDGDDFVPASGGDDPELRDSGLVAATRQTGVDGLPGDQHIATVDRSGRVNAGDRPVCRDRGADPLDFRTPGGRPGTGENRKAVKDDRDILDEDGVRQIGFFGKADHAAAQCGEQLLVGAMLRAGELEIDRVTIEVRELASVMSRLVVIANRRSTS
jgi:hypothetical protein